MPNYTSLSNHPKGLFVLALTELCERFAFWGVGNLLVLYLIEYYQFSNVKATHIYGIFTGCAAFLPLIGGWVADRSSYRMSILFGAFINIIGCLFLAWGTLSMLYTGLVIIAVGFGLFTPSLLVVLGYQYREKEHLRQAGFSIYYGSINIGVFLAMFFLGIIAKKVSWSAAFLVAAAVQTLGMIPIAWYFHRHKTDYQTFYAYQAQARIDKTPLSRPDRRRVFVVIIFCLLSIFFWTTYNQAYSSMSIFVHSYMNKEIGGYQIPEGVFLSSESFFLILLAPLLACLYSWLQKKHKDPSVAVKTLYSFLFMAAGFFIMMIGAKSISAGESAASVSPSYVISAYFLIAISEMLLAPIGLSMVSLLSPQKLTGVLMGFWYVCVGFAYYLGGLLAGLMGKGETLSSFFGFFIIISFIPAFFLILFNKKLTHMSRRDSNESDSTLHIPR